MTSPNTNIEKQKRRHWPVLAGIVGAIVLVVIGFIAVSPDEQSSEPAAVASDG